MEEAVLALNLPISWEIKLVFSDGDSEAANGSFNGHGSLGANGRSELEYEIGKNLNRMFLRKGAKDAGVTP